ncbi:MAG: hypothetical protein EXQ90_04440 [Rhodospirillales bacterium]|nr:hypothetical protein [Rhodospirillales bacterium]
MARKASRNTTPPIDPPEPEPVVTEDVSDATPETRPKRVSPFGIGLVAVAVAAALGAGLWVQTAKQDWATDDASVADARDRIVRLENTARQSAPATDSLRSVEDRITSLEREIDAMRRTFAGLSEATETARRAVAETAALEGRLARLEHANQAASPGLALAVTRLRAETATSRPFPTSFEIVQALASDPTLASAVAALEPRAATGVPTVDDLAVRFSGVARDLARTRPADSDRWWDQSRAWLETVVSVRRKDIDDPGLDGAIARTEAALQRRDLRGAVDALTGLDGRAAAIATAWVEAARARIAVDAAVDAIERQALLSLKSN